MNLLKDPGVGESKRLQLEVRLEFQPKAMEIRPVDPDLYLFFKKITQGPRARFWVRANGRLGQFKENLATNSVSNRSFSCNR